MKKDMGAPPAGSGHSPEGRRLQAPALPSVPNALIDCPRCGGTGDFVGSREISRCNHCIGTGRIRAADL